MESIFNIDEHDILLEKLKIFKEYDEFGDIDDSEFIILNDNKEKLIYYSSILSNYDN